MPHSDGDYLDHARWLVKRLQDQGYLQRVNVPFDELIQEAAIAIWECETRTAETGKVSSVALRTRGRIVDLIRFYYGRPKHAKSLRTMLMRRRHMHASTEYDERATHDRVFAESYLDEWPAGVIEEVFLFARGMSFRQIAAAKDVPKTTVEGRVDYARHKEKRMAERRDRYRRRKHDGVRTAGGAVDRGDSDGGGSDVLPGVARRQRGGGGEGRESSCR